ncbi:TetR/AcrR family transcriptional regulator [Gordonia sp. (in: high G+C Gram-positive bacteria)]|uniref:TetR/AcrR family transcriptional regulator n=1 Tax=Gordonia sp. (in: high G+C Gram-positive bacteria) TaxID=84139 RepID=UPI0039E4CB46
MTREQAKAERRADLLQAAARLMARSGFTAVRLEDIGAEVGVSGPAVYRHFDSKTDLLDTMLVDISERLLDGAQAAIAAGGPSAAVLRRLVDFHIDMLVTRPDLIAVQDRDLHSLSEEARHRVRSLQRRYVERWVDVLVEHAPQSRASARVRAQAVFGLLNSSPRLPDYPADDLRGLLSAMAWSALSASV